MVQWSNITEHRQEGMYWGSLNELWEVGWIRRFLFMFYQQPLQYPFVLSWSDRILILHIEVRSKGIPDPASCSTIILTLNNVQHVTLVMSVTKQVFHTLTTDAAFDPPRQGTFL